MTRITREAGPWAPHTAAACGGRAGHAGGRDLPCGRDREEG
ncbi:hypothetical protein SUDANB58_01614 [Streptomyces sp. enrichment culture]